MSDETVEAKYRLVVAHQLSVEQTCSLEVVTLDRERASTDALFFINLFTTAHEAARERAFREAEKKRDMLFQKIGNLQEEAQRLERVLYELKGKKVRDPRGKVRTLAEVTANGDSNG